MSDSFGFPTRFGRAPAQVSAFVSFPLLHSRRVALILTNHLRSERNSFFDQCVALPSLSKRVPAVQLTFKSGWLCACRTGGLWATGALVGKFGGIFTGAAGQHGGHESTIFTSLPFFAHHGITFVPLGYRAAEISNEERIVGG